MHVGSRWDIIVVFHHIMLYRDHSLFTIHIYHLVCEDVIDLYNSQYIEVERDDASIGINVCELCQSISIYRLNR